MSVDKVPNMAANGARLTKSTGSVKGGQGAGETERQDDGFGALLSSLGVDDAKPVVETSAGAVAPEDPVVVDANPVGNLPTSLTTIFRVPTLSTGAGVADELASSVATPVDDALGSAGGILMAADMRAPSALAGTKSNFHSNALSDSSEAPDALGIGNTVAKSARLSRERGRTEIVSTGAVAQTSAAISVDATKFELREVGARVEIVGIVPIPVAADALPLEAGMMSEFRREKAIFKAHSTATGSDFGVANGSDARPTSLSLEGMAPDVGGGMAQGDQSPGTYWVSSDMKNAEMKLDGFGESPVEVSISMRGNQAHVAFRTDEIETRLALADASVTLKDMLSKEGLDLAGVSVGTSGAGGDTARDHRPRQENRPMRIDNLASKFPSGVSGDIVSSRAGRLDVFV